MTQAELETRPFCKLKNCKFEISSKTKLTSSILDQLKDLDTIIFTDKQLSKMNTFDQNVQSSVAFEIYRKLATCWNPKLASALLCHLKRIPGNEDVIEFVQNCEESKKNLLVRKGSLITVVTTKKTTTSMQASHIRNSNIFYYFDKKIGGSTSKVFQGYFEKETWKAAVKRIDFDNSSQRFTKNYNLLVDRELEAWRKMSTEKSPGTSFLVSLLDSVKEQGKHYLCMELASRNFRDEIALGILNPFIKEDRKKIITYLKNIVEGLNWLHEQRILHRNIKPENILIFEYKKGNVAKLSDFGVSREISKSSGSLSEGRGSPEWMAPEALIAYQKDESEDKIFKNSKPLDIFSLGLIFYFGLTGGEHPFSSYEGGILRNIQEKDARPKLLLNQWALADHLLQWMMQKDPQKRPTVLQVNKHPFFWSSKEQLQFCLKVTASASDKAKSSTWNLIKTNLNSAYRIYSTQHLHLDSEQMDWTEKVDQLFFQRKSQGGKKYEPLSFMSCLELIRDKHQHQGDMVPELFSKFTDSEGAFSDEIYAEYFFDRFPDLVGILFCTLAYIARNNLKSLGSLNDDYFKDFHDCANGWISGADNMSKYLNVFISNS